KGQVKRWLEERSFPAGAPVLVMAIFSLLTGAFLAYSGRFEAQEDAQALTVWLFDATHADMLRGTPQTRSVGISPLTEQFSEQTGHQVDVQLVGVRPLDLRLVSMSQSGATGPFVPDLVEIEIGSIGKYFRGPPSAVGLL